MKNKVLIVGPSITETKGGMATVIQNMLEDTYLNTNYNLRYVISHVEKTILHKMYYTVKTINYLIINNKNYDIIHLHSASGASIYRKGLFVSISKLFRKKVILHMHGADFDAFFNNTNKLSKYIIRKIFKWCDNILLLSDSWLKYFKENIMDNNLLVLNNGVFTNKFEKYICNNSQYNKFLFLGRLGYRKGVYDIIKAVDILVNQHNINNFKIYLAGDGEINEVSTIINKLKLENNIKVLGWINNEIKKEYFIKSDYLLLPSYDEGLPMSLIEGMASGKILISTFVGGIPDLIVNGENGFLMKPGDVEKLVDIIEYVIHFSNRNKMEEIKRKNICKAKESYDLGLIYKRLDNIYKEVL
jgi:glycosyltransferase involved in cell wall biosynthesis